MELLKQLRPQCLLYSFAMILGEEPEILAQEVGSDGLEIWWPKAIGNLKHKGHHIQEMVDCCLRRGYMVTQIEAVPNFANKTDPQIRLMLPTIDEAVIRLTNYMKKYSGVLTSELHAVAWNHKEQLCYDPNGMKYSANDFTIKAFWLITN